MHERERVNKSKNYSFARPYLDVWVLGWNGREKKKVFTDACEIKHTAQKLN